MRLAASFVDNVNAVLAEQIKSATQPVAWSQIVESINGKNIEVKNWLHVRAVLQGNTAYKRTPSIQREEYVLVK